MLINTTRSSADYGDAYPQHKDVAGDTQPEYNLTCCTKNKLMAAKTALDNDKVPVSYIQLDDWWCAQTYYGYQSQCSSRFKRDV